MSSKASIEMQERPQIIVTGAGRGIGYDLCEVFSSLDCSVGAVSRQEYLSFQSSNIVHIQGDIANSTDVTSKIESHFHSDSAPLRILIHNAGLLVNKPFEDLHQDEIIQIQSVNYLFPLMLTQKLLPWLREAKHGHVIYIGSMGGFQGSEKYPGLSVYGSSKAAGAGLMEGLASEYRGTSLSFNALSLGAVDTDMIREAFTTEVATMKVRAVSSWIARFALEGFRVANGQNLPITLGNP
jgi:3-oxoacyl-[acyl-carrier protein] reductase